MVDTGVSKAPAFGFAGSSPAPGTNRGLKEVRKGRNLNQSERFQRVSFRRRSPLSVAVPQRWGYPWGYRDFFGK